LIEQLKGNMKTSELTGALLDYWVARAEGESAEIQTYGDKDMCVIFCREFSPSTDWAQGGPIIERERIQLEFHQWHKAAPWCALKHSNAPSYDERGPTPLVAAMRAYVASKFGDEVQDDGQN
jgi:hypothetical protein